MAQDEINEFLRESNAIEQEYSEEAFEDAQRAWDFAYCFRDKIDVGYVLGIHAILIHRLNPRITGKLRECDVWIGGKKKTFISLSLMRKELQNIILIVNSDSISWTSLDKSDYCKETHITFEQLHPFEDGNGRVGRILYNIHRINLGLPIHIIHEGEEQIEYYKWFK